MTTVHSKILALRSSLQSAFCERDREIDSLLIAALAREHILLLGPPGTAKSELARAFSGAIQGAQHFEWLLSRFSTPEELFGPVSLSALKADRFTRVTTGKLPEAHVAFLDEIFKANSAVLNSLLASLNERVFHNNGHPVAIPLLTCVGASNELPESAELGALWDRFLLRHWVDYVASPDSFAAIVSASSSLRSSATITLAEWDEARSEVAQVALPKAVIDALFRLRAELAQEGIVASDRRWRKCAMLLRAAAWIDGLSEVCPEHLSVLSAALWNVPDQAPKVAAACARFASAELADAQRAFDGLVEVLAKLPQTSDPAFEAKAPAARRELAKGVAKLRGLQAKASPGSARKIGALVADLEARSAELREAVARMLDL